LAIWGRRLGGGGWRGRAISFHSSVRRDPLGTPRGGLHSSLPQIESRDSRVQIAKQISVFQLYSVANDTLFCVCQFAQYVFVLLKKLYIHNVSLVA